MRRRLFLLIFSMLFGIVGVASACGGFFCTNTPIDQSAERIIFTINNDNTISAIVGINYEGAADDFSWVVPVPSPPELDVAPVNALNVLQNTTNPRFNPPPNYCGGVIWDNGGRGGGGGDYLQQGNVGPYDYAIIASDNPSEMIEWLRDNGYRVTEDMEPIIAEYVIEGMYFLAMKLSNDAEVGDIQPVKMTYISDKPTIPLRLTAVAALDDMPVLVWIFADQPYSPDNFAHPDVDFASFRASSQLRSSFASSDAIGDYFAERNRIQEEYDGKAFITEYAMPSINLMELSEGVVEDSYLTDLINSYSFVTRLRAQLSPEQMTLDPSFVPDPQQHHVPQTIDLAEYVDPLHYWGCSNREFPEFQHDERLSQIVPLPENINLRIPEGWVQSEVTLDELPFLAFAPQAVTAEDILAFFDGQSDFPILTVFPTLPDTDAVYYYHYKQFFPLASDYDLPETLATRFSTFGKLFTNKDVPTLVMVMLTTQEDFDENRDLYDDISSYLYSYQFYAHPELKHTLALAQSAGGAFGGNIFPPLQLGFPEGWTEFLQTDNSVVIVPDDGSSLKIELEHEPLSLSSEIWTALSSDNPEENLREFDLTDREISQIIADHDAFCQILPVTDYEADERVGYRRMILGWRVTVSSLQAEFEDNRETLRWIAESVYDGYDTCALG